MERPTTIMGVFSLRTPQSGEDPDHILAMANVYAALREIDAFTLQPDMFPSTLPVIGYTPSRATSQSALDMVLLTDDASGSTLEPPETALAECVATWLAASLTPPEKAPVLPTPIVHEPGTDRFIGYSSFGVSKLALPTRAAMDLAAVGLAQAALKAIKSANTAMSTAAWAAQMVGEARHAVMAFDLRHAQEVRDKLREWSFDMSAASLLRKQETRAAKGEWGRMLELIQSEWRRLERELVGENSVDHSAITTLPDSLRMRMNTALVGRLRDLHARLMAGPVDLAYGQGLGLIWVISALEELGREMRAALPELEHQVVEADAAYQLTRGELFEIAQQYETRVGGRFSPGRKASAAELEARAGGALAATVGLIIAQTRLDAWHGLRRLVDELTIQVRDVIPLVDQASLSVRQFEQTFRRAMEEVVNRPPSFPAGVALTKEWYNAGTQNVGSVGQSSPRDLLCQVFAAWNGGGLPAERQLRGFLPDVLAASRRALAGTFGFTDLYEFLHEHEDNVLFHRALAALPGAATPALVPVADDRHPAPTPYELVRETPRPFSALEPAQQGIIRSFVPSPDPDEITVIRVLHGVMAEAIPPLREIYRRSYERAGAEGMPLHIDRRWDSTMADLVHTSERREISTIWENLLIALHKNPHMIIHPLDALVRALGMALDVQDMVVAPQVPPDMRLVVYKLRPFRLKLPPPNCPMLFLYSNRSADELREDVLRALTPLPLEEQFAFVVNLTGRPDIDEIIEPLRRVDFTVLVLDEADIKHLVSARLPTRALSDLVLDQVSLTTVSPFYTRGPVPEHMFFGREREISEVRSKLRTHSVALIGGRRIGKTSALQRLHRLFTSADSEYAPYYLDCHGATNYNSFFWLIGRRWEVNISEDAHPVQFEDVITALHDRHPGKSLALLFDEVDSLLMYDRQPENQETLFRTLRSLSNEKRCQYVFSGEKWLMRSIGDPYSALFNFAQAVRLAPLPQKVVHHLVADPFEMLNIWIEQSEQVIDRIYQISAGHPNIVQMICQAMVEELDKAPQNASLLNVEHLDRATSHRTLQEEIVQTIWGQMNPLARLITLAWPEGVRFLSLAEIEDLLRDMGVDAIPPELLERTAKDLELYCFVRPRENDRLELIPMAFPAILDFMTDKRRQIEIVRQHYETDPQGLV
jgi:hypothetical protein